MKIILFLSLHVGKWGAERSMCSLCASLKNKYRVVVIITSHGSIEELLKSYNIEYYIIPLIMGSYMGDFKWIKTVLLKIRYPFLLYSKQSIFERTLKQKEITPSLIYTNTLIPINGFLLSQKYKIPHICHIREFYDEDFHFKSWIGRNRLFSLMKNNCDKFICISDAMIKKFSPILGYKKLTLVYNGLPIQRPIKRVDSDYLKALIVGRLSPEKNQFDAIKAIQLLVKKNVPIQLYIYGSGKDEKAIKEYIERAQLTDSIFLCGYADHIDYSHYQLGLMCSKNEAFGRVTVEYMMAGLPVIGVNSGATPEIVEEGVTGLLYSCGNNEELSQKILYYIKNREVAIKHGNAGHKRACRLFSENQYIDNMRSVIENIIKNKK